MVIRVYLKRLCLVWGLLLCCLTLVGAGSAIAASTAAPGVELPILMYHSILKDPALTGTYVLPPEQLESDLRYLKQHGYTAVLMRDVIAYASDPAATLPDKPVLLTFDDGNYNNYLYAYPLMEQYDMKCVLSIVGKYTDELEPGAHQSPNYSPLSWEQLKEMSDSGRVEVQNHTYNMHTIGVRAGARICAGETVEQYREVLKSDVGRLQELIGTHVGVMPNTFTYPFGKYSEASEPILREMGFQASLSCTEGVNYIQKGASLSLLKRFNRAPGETSEQFFARILT
ncbi:MAG: polysaccharide deacetylase family protein [Oscillospiraceae bacterium]